MAFDKITVEVPTAVEFMQVSKAEAFAIYVLANRVSRLHAMRYIRMSQGLGLLQARNLVKAVAALPQEEVYTGQYPDPAADSAF